MDPASLAHYMRLYPITPVQPTKAGEPLREFLAFGRMAFSYLDKPKANDRHPNDRTKDRYKANLILPVGTDLALIKSIFVDTAKGRFSDNWMTLTTKEGKPLVKNTFLRDQATTAAKYKGFSTDPTAKHIEATSVFPVPAFDANKLPMNCEKGKGVYSGMWCLMHFALYAYPEANKPLDNCGVSAGLRGIQKICDDEEFKSQDTGRAFGVVQHAQAQPGGQSVANGSAPATAPAAIPGF